MTATRADDAGGSATATTDLDPNSAWGGGDAAAAAHDFGPISDWDGGDEVTVANVLLPDVVDFNPTSGARKRKGRSTQNHAARDARRKRQHVAALLLTTQGNTKAGT